MPDLVCDTSPLQYVYQIGLLHIFPKLANNVIVPAAVEREISEGRRLGIDLPDLSALAWLQVRRPGSTAALPLITDLGPGEAEVLMLGLEFPGAVVVLDDGRARRFAEALGLPLTGTLGLLVDAKRAKLIPRVEPMLDLLEQLRFRLSPHTRVALLRLAEEGKTQSAS